MLRSDAGLALSDSRPAAMAYHGILNQKVIAELQRQTLGLPKSRAFLVCHDSVFKEDGYGGVLMPGQDHAGIG